MNKNILVAIIYIFLITLLTFPLAFKITTHIPGFFSTDEPFAALWNAWRIKYSIKNHLSLFSTDLINYPFGISLYKQPTYISYLWMFWFHLLSLLTTPVLTWNIQVLINIFLSAFFGYLLVSYLTKSRLAGLLSGIIFGFCPYQFVRIWQHLGLTYNQWLPLIILSAILLKENPSKKSLILFFSSLFLLFSFDWSVMYMGSVSLFSFLIYVFFYRWRIKFLKQRELVIPGLRFLGRVFISLMLIFVILSPQFFPAIKNRLDFSKTPSPSAFNPGKRPFEDLFTQSAKPLSYLLPAAVHPLFGKFTQRFIGSSLYGISFTEHTLYLGWVPIILSFIAYRYWRKKRRAPAYQNTSAPEHPATSEDFYIGFFIFLAIVACSFSQPPWWKFGPLKIYMPSFFMYKILPMFRAYCRFGIVVMLAIAVLAGFGLKEILSKRSTRAPEHRSTRFIVTGLFCGLVLFEFWNWPPYKVIDVSKVPEVYYWLKEKPGDFVIAEYPLDSDSPDEMYRFYQTVHEKKIINGTIPGTYANKVAQEVRNLSEPRTAGILKWMGVKYVLVHREDYLKTELLEWMEELDKIPKNPKLKFVKSFSPQECPEEIMCLQKTGPIDVYEVIADSIRPAP
ncbi:MAG: YfhO family protein [Candidatus Omnitrophica bacterium]|nr:YfhO family protein [Candidatus Omnitrophota bacterium]